jgi:hypothetical protein
MLGADFIRRARSRALLHPARAHRGMLGVAVLASVLFVLGALPGPGTAAPLPPVTSPVLPSVASAVSLSIPRAPPLAQLAPDFFGANVRPFYALGPVQSQAYQAAGLGLVRWPGGGIADRYNVTANRIYNDNGTYFAPSSSTSTFVSWCRSLHCAAVIGLPGEIDSPATAASYVSYIEQTLHFVPTAWEIGNEPAVWTHAGTAWTSWTTTQNQNTTPLGYAALVHAYIAAIRAVDPSARFVGLPGLGTGAYGEATWINATVRVNGPNLSAVSIHVYPAGGATVVNPTLAQFYATLAGPSSLAARVPADRAAIRAGCPSCSLSLMVGELGTGTDGGPFDAFMAGFPAVPYIAAELANAIGQNLSATSLYALQGTYDGSLLNGTGHTSPVGSLYATLVSSVGRSVLPFSATGAPVSLAVSVTRNPGTHAITILAANTNASASLSLRVQGAGVPALAGGVLWRWNGSTAQPTATPWLGNVPPALVVPASGVGILVLNASRVQPTLGSAVPWWDLARPNLSFSGVTITSLLGFVAPTSLTFPCWAMSHRGVGRRRRGDRTSAAASSSAGH